MARYNRLNERFGSANGGKILYGMLWIGMTKEMAIESVGNPTDITRTKFEWGLSETWYYKKGYETYRILHFDDGKLKIISDY